jgi:hypothetical protein
MLSCPSLLASIPIIIIVMHAGETPTQKSGKTPLFFCE